MAKTDIVLTKDQAQAEISRALRHVLSTDVGAGPLIKMMERLKVWLTESAGVEGRERGPDPELFYDIFEEIGNVLSMNRSSLLHLADTTEDDPRDMELEILLEDGIRIAANLSRENEQGDFEYEFLSAFHIHPVELDMLVALKDSGFSDPLGGQAHASGYTDVWILNLIALIKPLTAGYIESLRSEYRDLNELAEMLGIDKWDDVQERNDSYYIESADYAISEWVTQNTEYDENDNPIEPSEEARQEQFDKFFDEVQSEHYQNYRSALISTAEHFLDEVGMNLIELNDWNFTLDPIIRPPVRSWSVASHAVHQLMECIYGGEGYLPTLSQYADNKRLVLDNLNYLSRFGDCYGDANPDQYFERRLR